MYTWTEEADAYRAGCDTCDIEAPNLFEDRGDADAWAETHEAQVHEDEPQGEAADIAEDDGVHRGAP